MRKILGSCIAVMLCGLSTGCTGDDYLRTEGPTMGAGNAQAANTAMQMVDPWKYGVQNTKLRVPADRGVLPGTAASSTGAAPAQTSTTD